MDTYRESIYIIIINTKNIAHVYKKNIWQIAINKTYGTYYEFVAVE